MKRHYRWLFPLTNGLAIGLINFTVVTPAYHWWQFLIVLTATTAISMVSFEAGAQMVRDVWLVGNFNEKPLGWGCHAIVHFAYAAHSMGYCSHNCLIERLRKQYKGRLFTFLSIKTLSGARGAMLFRVEGM